MFKTKVTIGDVLCASLCQGASTVRYFQVVAVKGNLVKVREIMVKVLSLVNMSGECLPLLNEFIGDDVLTRRVNVGEYIRIGNSDHSDSFDLAYLEPYEIGENNQRKYTPHYVSCCF